MTRSYTGYLSDILISLSDIPTTLEILKEKSWLMLSQIFINRKELFGTMMLNLGMKLNLQCAMIAVFTLSSAQITK